MAGTTPALSCYSAGFSMLRGATKRRRRTVVWSRLPSRSSTRNGSGAIRN